MLVEDKFPSLGGRNELINKVINEFKNNLRSILIYGSVIKNSEDFNDLDIIIILKTKESPSKDTQSIKNILDCKKEKIDLQLLYEEELTNGNTFSLDTHGQFIIEELKSAIPVYGDNPFINLSTSPQMYQLSVIHKLQYYVFRARQEAMGYNFSTKDTSSDFHRKKIKMAMLDLLIAKQIVIKKSDNLLQIFIKHYPLVVNSEFRKLLTRKAPLNIYEALPIYEKLYDQALFWANKIYLEKRKSKIAKEKGIFFEYLLPKKTEGIPFIILCEGLPAKPCQDQLMGILVGLGYGVVYPRYLGTWESEGTFLENKPSDDISFLAKILRNGIALEGINVTANHVSLLATSFGASVALSTVEDKNIDKIIALSPVLDFKNFSALDSLKVFLKNMYPKVYRFTDSGWMNLKSGKIVPSASSVNKSAISKIFLFGGDKDKEIPSRELECWGNKKGISTTIFQDMGHITFSKIEGKLLENILNILNFSSKY